MNKILIGTGNQAKFNSYKKLLKDFKFEIVSAKDLNIPPPPENQNTFEKEAVAKARYYFEKSGIPTIADDGGFEIKALHGEPGIKSRRWIGREMTDEEIVAEVFKRMQGQADRSCKHTILLAIATPFGIFTAHGEVMGMVADKPSEKKWQDYPYSSVMYMPNYKKYWGDCLDENDTLNHRAHALQKLHDILKELEK